MSFSRSLPTFSFNTTAEEVGNIFADEIRGKTVLITGTSLKGIGFETARVIAKYAQLLIIAGYNEERLKLSGDAIKKETPAANIYRLTIDLSSLASVRKAAAEINALPDPLHNDIGNRMVSPLRCFRGTTFAAYTGFARALGATAASAADPTIATIERCAKKIFFGVSMGKQKSDKGENIEVFLHETCVKFLVAGVGLVQARPIPHEGGETGIGLDSWTRCALPVDVEGTSGVVCMHAG
ncbi:hypothetical protein R3P38DRAFT_3189066 [Favolaschia claudopus]|uniref:NAD(P)-binding protein n=1 Tax=Favolaschia claudopus TaxID=2862362 RepID=A0AAW0BVJ5_9AGAR